MNQNKLFALITFSAGLVLAGLHFMATSQGLITAAAILMATGAITLVRSLYDDKLNALEQRIAQLEQNHS